MKEQTFKGFWGMFLIGLLVLSFAVGYGFFSYFQTDLASLQRKNLVYEPNSSHGETTINVSMFVPEAIGELENGNQLYLISDESGNLLGLEAKKNDPLVNEMIAQGENLSQTPKPLAVYAYQLGTDTESEIQDYQSYIVSFFAGSEIEQDVLSRSYVSLAKLQGDRFHAVLTMLVAGGLGLFLLYSAIRHFRANTRAYQELYASYPELVGMIERAVYEADWSNHELKIAIYKNHLFTYQGGFHLVDLAEVERIYHYELRSKAYGLITTSRSSFLSVIKKDSKKIQQLHFKNKGKQTDEMLTPFFEYLLEHFPAIQLGYVK
ncbi:MULTISPECIES: hypothetical protein [unclassified Streptococcus]|uniref:hypothetical protein n=1 Tax=unclassified Streptococcus TaxID=2608887 RepID=UPI00107173E4|nr:MULTISPECIES: hypothetical protein [unclassified Streptococcus]MBF0786707.1 hypothetical protein [Streptococcus sp. 19428wC2_LYSM12]MCQ9211685.1 hypothetical protein [Streptococcus sp. B01]MCQ9213126.1 hypothetical protein [Streptococcus sp. O1]TFV06457.1 hypothetical protein E4T79_02045 [Streptococcus sp. LYSM12]